MAHAHGHHGGHGDHAEGGPARGIGITMAILGVLLALCAAMVGSERTELTQALVEQTQADNAHQAEMMKHRMMMSELQMLHALTPSKAEVKKFESSLDSIRADAGKGDNPEVMQAIQLSSIEIADILSPDHEDLAHLASLVHKYDKEAEVAREWTDAYEPAIHAHFEASETYDKAQLLAEIGIVIASIGLLLSSRGFWYVSIGCGVVSAALIAFTWFHAHHDVTAAEAKIHAERGDYEQLREQRRDPNVKDEDDILLERIERGEDAGQFTTPGAPAEQPKPPEEHH